MGVSSVTIVTGGRQTRKSTLAKRIGGNVPCLSLDSLQILDQARSAPASLLAIGNWKNLALSVVPLLRPFGNRRGAVPPDDRWEKPTLKARISRAHLAQLDNMAEVAIEPGHIPYSRTTSGMEATFVAG